MDAGFAGEVEYILINDPQLKRVMEDPILMDFFVIIGEDKSTFSLNLTMFAVFSSKMREYLREKRRKNSIEDKVEFPELSKVDFAFLHELLTRGRLLINQSNILAVLKMAIFFEIDCLLDFLIDFVEKNEDYIDRLDFFLFAYEANSKYLYSLASNRIQEMGELPFLSDKIAAYFSEKALIKLLKTPRLKVREVVKLHSIISWGVFQKTKIKRLKKGRLI